LHFFRCGPFLIRVENLARALHEGEDLKDFPSVYLSFLLSLLFHGFTTHTVTKWLWHFFLCHVWLWQCDSDNLWQWWQTVTVVTVVTAYWTGPTSFWTCDDDNE
jgi:hypothetical protein